MESHLEAARMLFLEGVAHYQAGRMPQAEQKFVGALALVPGRPSVLTNLGAVRLKLGRLDEAVAVLQEALAQEPDNPEALGHYATALAEQGRITEALDHFDRALAADPKPATPWMLRGTALRELGRAGEAAASFREALARGGDPDLLGYYLAAVEAGGTPAHPPRQYVEALFDNYAAQFDQHVVQELAYDAPRVLLQRLATPGRHWAHALDLGCGTGLAGRLLRPLADRVTGVDLSVNMLERAAALGVYDRLQQADALEFLVRAEESFDLLLAADVFIYVGALDEVFAAAAQRVSAGGTFCFTVEESESEAVVLRSSLRYAHSEAGIRALAQQNGFQVAALEKRPVRQEQRQPIPGLFFWLERA